MAEQPKANSALSVKSSSGSSIVRNSPDTALFGPPDPRAVEEARKDAEKERKALRKVERRFAATGSELAELIQQQTDSDQPPPTFPKSQDIPGPDGLSKQQKPDGLSPKWLLSASALLLVMALAGIALLRGSRTEELLWFLFLLVVYPVVFAFTLRVQVIHSVSDLLTLYRTGLSQISKIGEVLTNFATGDGKKKDS